jgi:hypothetical protein
MLLCTLKPLFTCHQEISHVWACRYELVTFEHTSPHVNKVLFAGLLYSHRACAHPDVGACSMLTEHAASPCSKHRSNGASEEKQLFVKRTCKGQRIMLVLEQHDAVAGLAAFEQVRRRYHPARLYSTKHIFCCHSLPLAEVACDVRKMVSRRASNWST